MDNFRVIHIFSTSYPHNIFITIHNILCFLHRIQHKILCFVISYPHFHIPYYYYYQKNYIYNSRFGVDNELNKAYNGSTSTEETLKEGRLWIS